MLTLSSPELKIENLNVVSGILFPSKAISTFTSLLAPS